MICKCGCNKNLRKDNKTGYAKGHKPCPICGSLVNGSSMECCSKSCSAKLHWINHPEMKDARVFNEARFITREKNRDKWIKNLSRSCIGREPWNKNKPGLQVAWNKDLSPEHQPFFGKKHSQEYFNKRDSTVLQKYGVKYTTELATTTPRSKREKLLEPHLPEFKTNQRIGKYRPDYVNYTTMHIIEVYGDYWHCNPETYADSFYHRQHKMTAKEKRDIDLKRIGELEKLGYKVDIIWDSELNEYISSLRNP